jgi:hypothetical protein
MSEEMLIPLFRLAGGIQIGILAANALLPRRLDLRANLDRLSPIARMIFVVHWGYILLVLVLFAALCLAFAPELAGRSPLARFLSVSLAVFWWSRMAVQLFCYGPTLWRKHPWISSFRARSSPSQPSSRPPRPMP